MFSLSPTKISDPDPVVARANVDPDPVIDPAADLDPENDPAPENVAPVQGIGNADPARDRDPKNPSRKSLGANNCTLSVILKNLVTAGKF